MKRHLFLLASVALLASCAREQNPSWTLRGTAPGGTTMVYLEEPTVRGGWQVIDSVTPSGTSYEFSTPAAPGTIYRVSVGSRVTYIPACGTETITLTEDGRRSGSEEAVLFNIVDSTMRASADVYDLLKALDGKYATLGAYYATMVNGNPRLIKTVANRFNEERAGEPLTVALLARVNELDRQRIRRDPNADHSVIVAPEIGYYDIELPDAFGTLRKLSDVVDSNPLTILAFADTERPGNSSLTMALGEARQAGAAIYEVGFDRNIHLWADRTGSLPWTNVFFSESTPRTVLSQYLVSELPTIFIISDGTITHRLSDPAKIKSVLK